MKLIRRGDIWLINFRPDGREGEAEQTHPGIVVSNNVNNARAPLLQTVPLISNTGRVYVTNVVLPNQRTGLDYDSKAQIEATRATHVSRLVKRLGFVPDDLMLEIDGKLRMHFGL
ncbi:type II toxin-antitoxin system PemK/MazF family toxin [Deinococcus marmoris]|uniref:mRNA interferase n=1 Tax=Deinococcus marmoris TaxID=249408 RepID=A0A1U7NZB9_9DEIO|nr:type II toxin-antitoxin system PemK/MazF family toxin [Deinococcus marmoris]OLV18263.1 Programmed cell death toxin YdcE [Deinococcus marmoris]